MEKRQGKATRRREEEAGARRTGGHGAEEGSEETPHKEADEDKHARAARESGAGEAGDAAPGALDGPGEYEVKEMLATPGAGTGKRAEMRVEMIQNDDEILLTRTQIRVHHLNDREDWNIVPPHINPHRLGQAARH